VASKLTFRQLVTQQYSALFEKSKSNLVNAQRTSLHNIVKGKQIVCMCSGNITINSKEWRIMKCCGHLFHYPCITYITDTTGVCPACGHNAPPAVVATKRENDTVRDKLVKKRKKAQVHQGEKKKNPYANSLQQIAENVNQALVATVFVDQRVASHARGVLAIVVERKSTGAFIACSKAGIITHGLGKKVCWIPSDG